MIAAPALAMFAALAVPSPRAPHPGDTVTTAVLVAYLRERPLFTDEVPTVALCHLVPPATANLSRALVPLVAEQRVAAVDSVCPAPTPVGQAATPARSLWPSRIAVRGDSAWIEASIRVGPMRWLAESALLRCSFQGRWYLVELTVRRSAPTGDVIDITGSR